MESADAALNGDLGAAAMVAVSDGPAVVAAQGAIKEKSADQIVAVRVSASPDSARRVVELALDGIELYYEVSGTGEPLLLIAGQEGDHHGWDEVRGDFERYQTKE